jgi:hypothetical protein
MHPTHRLCHSLQKRMDHLHKRVLMLHAAHTTSQNREQAVSRKVEGSIKIQVQLCKKL